MIGGWRGGGGGGAGAPDLPLENYKMSFISIRASLNKVEFLTTRYTEWGK